MTISDIEYLIILLVLLSLFIIGMKKHELTKLGGADLNTTNALKGIACVFILLGHYGQRKFIVPELPWGISRVVCHLTASIALTWFMYFSGYGLSLKENNSPIFQQWWSRMKKIYLPLFFVCVLSLVLYLILPDKYTFGEYKSLWLSTDIYNLHHFTPSVLPEIIEHCLGWKDWYVFCILIFYSFFYFSQHVARKLNVSQTPFLWILMCFYFVWAYFVFGSPEAHWYRFCWVFFGGHVHARWKFWSSKERKIYLLLFAILASSVMIQGLIMMIVYLIATSLLLVVFIINRRYTIESKILLFLGGISFFFYLSHIRIGYNLMTYIGWNSIILWIVVTILCSMVLDKVFSSFKKSINN